MTKLNGTTLRNLEHLAWLVTNSRDGKLTFEIRGSTPIVLDADIAKASTAGTLQDHSIPHALSKDLRAQAEQWTDVPPIKPASKRAHKAAQISHFAGQLAAQRGEHMGIDTSTDIFKWDPQEHWPG